MIKIDKYLNSLYSVENEQVHYLRILFSLIYFFACPFPQLFSIGEIPNYLYSPNESNISYFLFSEIPHESFFYLIDAIMILSFCGVVIGVKHKLSAYLLTICLILYKSVLYSFQKIDHTFFNDIIFFVLAFSNWGESKFLIRRRETKVQFFNFFLVIFFLFFCFFSAGILKVFDSSYWMWNTTHVSDVIFRYGVGTEMFMGFLRFLPFDEHFSKKIFDYVAIFFEVLGPFLLFKNMRAGLLFVIFCCAFHIMNFFFLGIQFIGVQSGYVLILLIFYLKLFPLKISISEKLNGYLAVLTVCVILIGHYLIPNKDGQSSIVAYPVLIAFYMISGLVLLIASIKKKV